MYKLSEIASITRARLYGHGEEVVSHYMYDSRSSLGPEGTLFVAIRTERNDGHQFIQVLIERGFRNFLVDEAWYLSNTPEPGCTWVVAGNSLDCLQKLAAHHRTRFSIPVIGITGSNGKTMVKEWLYQLLRPDHVICRSPKSYNSQIGVPLSVLQLRPFHTLAVFEAGISKEGEMSRLEEIIRPDIAVFTSFGSAHNEGFRNEEQKLEEKLKLFRRSKKNVFNHVEVKTGVPGENYFIGHNGWQLSSRSNQVRMIQGKEEIQFEIPFTDEASHLNASTCAIIMRILGYQPEIIRQRMTSLQPLALRLEIKNGIRHALLINDFYNSDLDSLQIALDQLTRQSRRKRKVVVLSDIEQSGLEAADLYKKVARSVEAHHPDLLIGVGKSISAHYKVFTVRSVFYESTEALLGDLRTWEEEISDATVLLKGARSFGFEKISRLLQQKSHDTVLEIDLSKLAENVRYYRSLLQPGVKLMCMVKAMGYGSGGAEIARTLEQAGASYLAVAYADEGVELRESHIRLPIMVMNPEEEGFSDIIKNNLEPELYNLRVLESFVAELDRQGITDPFPVHIKIDTGMHRLGFAEDELQILVEALDKFKQLHIRSVFSHLAASEDRAHDDFTREQMRIYEKACELVRKTVGYDFLKHICNSAGISRFPEAHYDMVRLGIGMYGIGTDELEQQKLQAVGTLKTRLSQIREIKPGETVGYGRKAVLPGRARIGVIPVGYADGFPRMLGNGAHGVYVNGTFCPTVGNICMDMCMIDVTGVSCEEGDEVILFSSYEHLAALSRAMNTIPYEVLTSVSPRVKRVYVQE